MPEDKQVDDEPVYRRHVQYLFTVSGEVLAMDEPDHDGDVVLLHIEETRKNGQEDCHMSGVVMRSADGTFTWDYGSASFDIYGPRDFSSKIIAFLNQHGLPTQ